MWTSFSVNLCFSACWWRWSFFLSLVVHVDQRWRWSSGEGHRPATWRRGIEPRLGGPQVRHTVVCDECVCVCVVSFVRSKQQILRSKTSFVEFRVDFNLRISEFHRQPSRSEQVSPSEPRWVELASLASQLARRAFWLLVLSLYITCSVLVCRLFSCRWRRSWSCDPHLHMTCHTVNLI